MSKTGKIGAVAHCISKQFRFNVIIPMQDVPGRDFISRALETAINWREKFVRGDVTLRVGEPRTIGKDMATVN